MRWDYNSAHAFIRKHGVIDQDLSEKTGKVCVVRGSLGLTGLGAFDYLYNTAHDVIFVQHKEEKF